MKRNELSIVTQVLILNLAQIITLNYVQIKHQ